MTMNLPNNPNEKPLPEEAKGNPIYEQTRQDMPLFCCGRNCGRNSRIVVLVLAIIGITCSILVCLSPKYFHFEALRNDTFFDEDKFQPEPFKYATEANVGLFKYEILEVYYYPWPPEKNTARHRSLSFSSEENEWTAHHERSLQDNATTANTNGTDVTTNATDTGNTTAAPVSNATEAPVGNATDAPGPVIPPPGPGGFDVSASPTYPPTPAPTISDPNEDVPQPDGVKRYSDGEETLDTLFHNAQRGAKFAPILAFIGVIFGLIELCCCVYKCSWLPTALFLYAAFMLQSATLFFFLSEDFCKYAQDCRLGFAGWMSVIAIICYMISNTLVCCTPRPQPCFNCCKKPPVRRKKNKKKPSDDDDLDDDDPEKPRKRGFDDDDDDEFEDEPGTRKPFRDDPDDEDIDDGYVDPYYDDGTNTLDDDDVYNNRNAMDDDDTYGGNTYGDDTYDAGEDEEEDDEEEESDDEEGSEEESEEEDDDESSNQRRLR